MCSGSTPFLQDSKLPIPFICKGHPETVVWGHHELKSLKHLQCKTLLTQTGSHWNQASSIDSQGRKTTLPRHLLQWLLQGFQMCKSQAEYSCRKKKITQILTLENSILSAQKLSTTATYYGKQVVWKVKFCLLVG